VVDDFESLSEKLARATNECERLRQENSRLRELLNRELLNQAAPRSEEPLVAIPQDGSETRPDSALAAPDSIKTPIPAMPVSWQGTLQQYVGRLHRLHDSKKVVEVYAYVDYSIPMLARMFDKRLRGYKELGYAIHSEDAALADGEVN